MTNTTTQYDITIRTGGEQPSALPLDTTLEYQTGYYNQTKNQIKLGEWIEWLKTTNLKPENKPYARKLFPQKQPSLDLYSGIVCIDIDEPTPEALDKIKAHPAIFAGGVSISGNGIWALAATQISQNNTIDRQIYATIRLQLQKELNENLDQMMTSNKFGRTASSQGIFVKQTFKPIIPIIKTTTSPKFNSIFPKSAGEKLIKKVTDSLRQHQEGSRNAALFKAAAYLAAKEIDHTMAKEQLTEAALATGLPLQEIKRTLISAGYKI